MTTFSRGATMGDNRQQAAVTRERAVTSEMRLVGGMLVVPAMIWLAFAIAGTFDIDAAARTLSALGGATRLALLGL
jgi:hypothetical protein